ncbi:hypothetical protein D3C85_1737440 [compost metagenome]
MLGHPQRGAHFVEVVAGHAWPDSQVRDAPFGGEAADLVDVDLQAVGQLLRVENFSHGLPALCGFSPPNIELYRRVG